MNVYTTKPNTWFDEGTQAILIDDYRYYNVDIGLFEGLKDGKPDEEICSFDEFKITDTSNNSDIELSNMPKNIQNTFGQKQSSIEDLGFKTTDPKKGKKGYGL